MKKKIIDEKGVFTREVLIRGHLTNRGLCLCYYFFKLSPYIGPPIAAKYKEFSIHKLTKIRKNEELCTRPLNCMSPESVPMYGLVFYIKTKLRSYLLSKDDQIWDSDQFSYTSSNLFSRRGFQTFTLRKRSTRDLKSTTREKQKSKIRN